MLTVILVVLIGGAPLLGNALNTPVVAFAGQCSASSQSTCLFDVRTSIPLRWAVIIPSVDWLPDMSGAVYTTNNGLKTSNTRVVNFAQEYGRFTDLNADNTAKLFPVWSPDGERIAFFTTAARAAYHLHVINGDGTPLTEPFPIDGNSGQGIVWSPDGTRLLYNATTGPYSRLVHIYDPATNTTRQVCEGPTGHADWSPDGTRVVCMIRRDNADYLLFVDAASGDVLDERGVATQPEVALFPVWSPDGRHVAFIEQQPGAVHILRVYDVTGRELRTASDTRFGALAAPAWLDEHRILQPTQTFFFVANLRTDHTRRLRPTESTMFDFYGVVAW